MFLYLDSLFAEGRERDVRPPAALPGTWNRLYLAAMRDHARRAAFLHWEPGEARRPGRWAATPDWRLDRHAIRLGLYLRERIGVGPGTHVAILSEPRPEWWVSDFAILGLGAVSVGLDVTLPAEALRAALAATRPAALLASAPALRYARAAGVTELPERRIVWNGPDPLTTGVSVPFDAALDFGGTLDTPERASAFRAQAREVPPEALALLHIERDADSAVRTTRLTQSELIAEVERIWRAVPARRGDLAYVAAAGCSFECRRAVYAFVGDGLTTTALGSAARAAGEIAALRPDKIVAPAQALAALAARHEGAARARPRVGRLRHRLRRRPRPEPDPLLRAVGGRARWIAAAEPADPETAARLANATLEPEPAGDRRKDGTP